MERMRLKIRLLMVSLTCLVWTQAQPAHAYTVEDAIGQRIQFERPPGRIVSLAPSITEILFSLGLGERVAGVTTFSNYPVEATLRPKVGSYINLNVEKIISLAPELVIGTVDGNRKNVTDLLEQAGIKVFIVNPRDVASALETIEWVGAVAGVPERGKALRQRLERRLSHIQKLVSRRRRPDVFMQINLKPIMTVNRDTFLNDLIRLSGGHNLFENEPVHYPRINVEEIIARKPEVILISSMEPGGRFEAAREDWLKMTVIPAARDKRVHLIDSDMSDRPGPRIVDALEIMARFIHPEVAWQ
jgi:iron complex transport system substrate-binding protein